MRPPYNLCRNHCRYVETCRPVLDTLTEYSDQHGKLHPIGLILDMYGCAGFYPATKGHE